MAWLFTEFDVARKIPKIYNEISVFSVLRHIQ